MPTDKEIVNIDPVLKMWLFYQWLGDHRDEADLAKNHAYLLGSFWNAEAVQKLMNDNVHESSDDDMEESMKMITDSGSIPLEVSMQKGKNTSQPNKRRHRATLKD